MNTQECDILNLVLSNTYTNQRTLAEDSDHSLGIVNRSIKTLIAEGYLDESIQPTQKAIEILYNFTKDIKKYIWKDSIKTYLEEQNEPTEELDMLCNMMQNIKDRYKAFKKSVRFDGQIIEISGKEYVDMVMKYARMLPEYNVKKAEKELQDFKDNKINLLTNKEARKNKVEKVAKGTGEVVKEAIVYTGGSLVKNTIKSILHIS